MNIQQVIQTKTNPNIPTLAPGDTVRVHVKVVEGEKERIQVFQGTVIGVQRGVNFTVRRVAYGSGVERTFPLASPLVSKVEVLRHGKVRRAKLYYLRGLTTKKSRLKERRETGVGEERPVDAVAETTDVAVVPEAVAAEAPATPAPAAENSAAEDSKAA